MKLQVVGCSHHNSPIQVRERLAFTSEQAGVALERFRRVFPATEAVLLSTCNRVEIYTAADDPARFPTHEQLVEFLAGCHGIEPYEVFDDLFERTGEDAIRHLFTVAASLDSMVVGEPQILSQVKQAYALATSRESAGPLTHSAFQAAVRVARRVAAETTIHERRVSIPSVAVADYGRGIFERFDDKRILVIGAGEMAEETLRYLQDEGGRDVNIVNRNPTRALELARRVGGTAAPWGRLPDLLVEADIVVSTTGSDRPIVTLDDFEQIEQRRQQRTLFILDLAVPRDFEPAIGECLGVYLHSVDDLKAVCEANRRLRDKEFPRAMAIIEEETREFIADLNHRATGPIIQRLRQGWEVSKSAELRRLFNKLSDLPESSRDEIAHSFDRLINKLLHPPLESLRDESRHGAPHGLLEALKRLFHLRD